MRVDIDSFDLKEPERYLAVLSKYGKALNKPDFESEGSRIRFSRYQINRDISLILDEEIEFLTDLGVLEKNYSGGRPASEIYTYELNQGFKDLAVSADSYIANKSDGYTDIFVEKFSESDLSSLRNEWSIEI